MSRFRAYILPLYLLLCILIGGSSQAVWGNAFLQLIALAILAWAALAPDSPALSGSGRRLLLIIGAVALLFVIQLVPLPPGLWTQLPGRAFVEDGLRLLGVPLPWLPISLSPYDTMTAALALLPPFALLAAMIRLRCWSSNAMFAAILAGATISILLGVLQVSGGEGGRWYFYQRTNLGIAVGTFANGNHYATILLASLPMLAALAAVRWRSAKTREQRSLTLAMAAAGAAVLAIGVLINRSAAMLLLGPAVAVATGLMVLRLPPRRSRQALAGVGLLLLAGAAALALFGGSLTGWGTDASVQTRAEYWAKSAQAAEDHLLTGAGIGTFEKLYRQLEDPAAVDRWYVNHAHNDYLELAVEGGLAAIVLMVVFLWWWAARASEAWRSSAGLEQKAATIASAAILAHSMIDFPLRTAAISAVFAVCLALLAGARGHRGGVSDDLERPRHATL